MKSLKSLEFPEGALLFCIALAVLFGLFALLGRWEDKRIAQKSVPTLGKVVAVMKRTEIERNKDGPDYKHHYYTPVVEFTDAQNRTVKFSGRYDTHLEDEWKTGMTVRVLYRVDNPGAAVIDTPSQLGASYRIWRTMMFVALIVGGLLFGLGKFEANRKPRRAPLTGEEARRAYFGE